MLNLALFKLTILVNTLPFNVNKLQVSNLRKARVHDGAFLLEVAHKIQQMFAQLAAFFAKRFHLAPVYPRQFVDTVEDFPVHCTHLLRKIFIECRHRKGSGGVMRAGVAADRDKDGEIF